MADVQEFRGNIKAIENALRHVRADELLVIQADVIDETMEFLSKVLTVNGSAHEIDLVEAVEVPTPDAAVYYASQIVD